MRSQTPQAMLGALALVHGPAERLQCWMVTLTASDAAELPPPALMSHGQTWLPQHEGAVTAQKVQRRSHLRKTRPMHSRYPQNYDID